MGITPSRVRVVQFAADTGGGTQDVTVDGLDDLPKAVLFSWSYGITNGTARDFGQIGMGAADADLEQRSSVAWAHKDVFFSAKDYGSDTSCIALIDPSADDTDGLANVTTFIQGGCRLNWSETPSEARLITATFFSGSEVEAKLFTVDFSTGAIGQTYTTGFPPEVAIGLSHRRAFDETVTNTANFTASVWSEDLNTPVNYSLNWYSEIRAANGQLDLVQSFEENLQRHVINVNGIMAQDDEIRVSSVDDTSMTLLADSIKDTNVMALLVLNMGLEYEVTRSIPATSTGLQAITGTLVQPQAALLLTTRLRVAAGTLRKNNTAGCFGVGAMDSCSQAFTGAQWEANVTPPNTQAMTDTLVVNQPEADGSVASDHQLNFYNFTSDGWVWNVLETDASGAQFPTLLFGVDGRVFAGSAGQSARAGAVEGQANGNGVGAGEADGAGAVEAQADGAGVDAGEAGGAGVEA